MQDLQWSNFMRKVIGKKVMSLFTFSRSIEALSWPWYYMTFLCVFSSVKLKFLIDYFMKIDYKVSQNVRIYLYTFVYNSEWKNLISYPLNFTWLHKLEYLLNKSSDLYVHVQILSWGCTFFCERTHLPYTCTCA